MLFQSQGFILIFLPLMLAAYYATARRPLLREWVLLAGSLVFYSWWDPRFLPILLAQSTATWGAVELYRRTGRAGWLWAGVTVNFASLAFFKYTAFLAGSLADSGRREGAADLHRAADRDQLFHLPARLLPGRRGARRCALLSLAARHPVRVAVPAPDRRADRAPPPDHAAARRRPAAPRVARALRHGPRVLHHRLRQEGVPRRSHGALRRPDLRGGGDLDAVAGRRLARRARLLVPAVPRLLGLQRDGDRPRSHAGRALPRQLRHALSRQRPREFLAALAHDAVAADPRLPVHPAGRQPPRLGHLCEGDAGHHGPVRAVARGGLDLRGMGPDARGGPRRLPGVAAATRSRCRRRSAGR